jgi:hypothetical protein
MGWTSFNLRQPVKVWFKELWETSAFDYEVLNIALVKRNTLYAAIKVAKTNEIFCAVYLIRWSRNYYNFSYKNMTEHSGPCVDDCPKRIMKLLTPLNDENDSNGWAREWRKRVEDRWNKIDILKKSKDCIIKTEKPVEFTSGASYQYFKKVGRGKVAGLMINGEFEPCTRVRFNLDHFNYEILPKDLVVS